MRRTTHLSLIFGALLAGAALGRFGIIAGIIPVAAAALAAGLAWRSRLFVACLILLALAIGLWRTSVWAGEQQRLAGLIGHSITATGTVIDDPTHNDKGQVSFKFGNIQLVEGPHGLAGQRIAGTISVFEYPVRVQRGHQVQLMGKVKAGFGNSVAAMSFPKFELLSTHQDWLEQLRQRFFAGIKAALPEPLASFGLGLLVGIRALIPKDMADQLTLVGLSHLVAVSGYNLTIIVAAVDRALKRFGRGVALVTSLWLIVGFLIVTGASASIVRASLVGVLSLLASFYGRRFNPITLILIVAGVTAAWDPKYLTDLGWLLSFLAFFGILVLAPAVEARLGHPKLVVARLFIESTAAQILTLPLILWMFSHLSIVSPITNLIILPLIPLAMAVSFIAGLAGIIIPAFAGWLAWPALLVLGFITQLINGFAALPWAGRPDHLSLAAMLAAYAVIVLLIVALKQANSRRGATEATQRVLEPIQSP